MAFKLTHGYNSAITGIPQTPVSQHIKKALNSPKARRAIKIFLKDKQESVLFSHLLRRDKEVFYFVKGTKFGEWNIGVLRKA